MSKTCPKCGRPIDDEDDVVDRGGVVYHEECAPQEAGTILSRPDSPVVNGTRKVIKNMSTTKKKVTNEDLLLLIEGLKGEIDRLKTNGSVEKAPKKKSERGVPRESVYYEIQGFPSDKRPPQCMRVMRCLAQAAPEGGRMTEVEVHFALMGEGNKLGPWNYAQTPFYIFKYYRANMIDAGYIRGPFDV